MNKFISLVMVILFSVIALFPQSIKSKNKKRKSSISTVQKIKSVSSDKSNIRNFDLRTISTVKYGDVFVGGYVVTLEDKNGKKIPGGGVLLKISNGKTKITKLPYISSIDEMFFVDNSTGWIKGYGSGTFKTTDGGETWQKLENSDDIRGAMFFLDADTGWYFGIDEYLKSLKNGKIEKLKLFDNFPKI